MPKLKHYLSNDVQYNHITSRSACNIYDENAHSYLPISTPHTWHSRESRTHNHTCGTHTRNTILGLCVVLPSFIPISMLRAKQNPQGVQQHPNASRTHTHLEPPVQFRASVRSVHSHHYHHQPERRCHKCRIPERPASGDHIQRSTTTTPTTSEPASAFAAVASARASI